MCRPVLPLPDKSYDRQQQGNGEDHPEIVNVRDEDPVVRPPVVRPRHVLRQPEPLRQKPAPKLVVEISGALRCHFICPKISARLE